MRGSIRELFDNAPVGYHELDINGHITRINRTEINMLGYSPEEIIGQCAWKFSEDEVTSRQRVLDKLKGILLPTKGEERIYRRKDQTTFSTLVEENILRDSKNNIIGIRTTIQNITKLKNAEKEMIEAKEKAEQMNRLKTNFLANMSHELRTPLIGILGYAEFLENELTDKELKQMARIIKSSGERLHKTLNNILDISKIETEKQRVNIKEHDLIKYLIEQIELFRAAAEGKGLSLNFETKEEILKAYIDEEMFVSIINNLLDNAIKYTNTGGVTLIAKRERDSAVIEIIDTGIGVHEDLYDLIFEPFRQASEGYGRSHEGTGLGLTLVKKYTELMGGTIVLKNKLEDISSGLPTNMHSKAGGSTFMLTLPTKKITTEVLINTNWK